MAQARESQPVCLTNSLASSGLVRQAFPSSTLMSSSTPPSMPSSASTEMPLAWARVDDALGDRDVLVERIVRGIDHHRAE